ncbi:uncharacterized protein PAC_12037 [Phialocephala subalpina]|uniref:Uncharacterized protein n=1 Tax=Phialocephala subalpina TaxID=576137 RepID=A0A1L7XAS6_9HELO|nr:uncharacterized protein PAC_12037 [Phialocephala subalpina]
MVRSDMLRREFDKISGRELFRDHKWGWDSCKANGCPSCCGCASSVWYCPSCYLKRWGTILEFEKLSGDTKLEKCMEGKELQALEGEKGWAEIGKKDKDWVEVVVSPGMDKEKMEREHGETEHVRRKRHKCDHESESTISLLTSFATSFIKKFPPN